MLIRPGMEADAEGCARVMVAAMEASEDYKHPGAEDIWEQSFRRVSGYRTRTYSPGFALDERAMFLAEESEQIIAFIAGHRTLRFGCDGELQWAFVLPEWQGRGIGDSLLACLRRWFVGYGMKKVCVNAPADISTRGFYLKHGAVPMNEHWVVWEDIGAKSVKR